MVIPASSLEYVSVTVAASPANAGLGSTPRFAFLPSGNRGNPEPADWLPGEWDGDTTARILVGPGGDITLTPGDWRVWVRIDPPGEEDVVRLSGVVSVQ
ncbi:hypothetical protein AB0C77_06640 [Streptomyces sp. NPDC048629]|uniref:hypothetical protein n=1 Tax=Streptomyces sp. NPDC048629 TaxID=3154824 RepID=UPI003416723C